MPANRDHHTSKENTFQILVIPQGDAGKRRSFTASVGIFIAGSVGIVLLIVAFTVAIIVFTPVGSLLPVSDAEMERRYGTELVQLQKRLAQISEEVVIVREYNLKLRSALGESVPHDTTIGSAPVYAMSEDESEEATPAHSSAPLKVQEGSSEKIIADQVNQKIVMKAFQASFPITAPVSGYVSRRFEDTQGHLGIDYVGSIGTLITAAADGYIVFASWTYDDGNMIILSHGGGYFTIYKHNQTIFTSVGEFVKRGQPISLLGNSGRTSYGPHLHFELWKDGQPQNPEHYLIASEIM